MTYDVAVIGLGGMGSAALAHVARRGARAIGIEQFSRLHAYGSSAGKTRMIRKAYFEDPAYVPLLRRAYDLWRELETETSRKLMALTGVLMVGTPDRPAIVATQHSAKVFELPLEVLDADEIAARYPGTAPRPGEIGLLERDAGMVYPEAAIDAHLRLAERAGAEMRFETMVARWTTANGVHRLTASDGSTIQAHRVVVCAGPWLGRIATDLALPLRVQRNVQLWFHAASHAFDVGQIPAFFVERADLPANLYGFPTTADGLKAAFHGYGETTDPDALDREIHSSEVEAVRRALESWLPGSVAGFRWGKACMYTRTPDDHFIVDLHPRDRSTVILGGFSGHGYKFCPVMGEIAADLALDGATRHDIGFLSARRFEISRSP